MKNLSATIIGPYVIHNFGDDLIGAILSKSLTDRGYSVNIPGLSKENCEWLGINWGLNRRQAIKTTGTLILGGGGLLADAGVVPNNVYQKMAFKAALYAAFKRKRILTTAIGAGPLDLKSSRALAYGIGLLSEKIGVRDRESFEFLSKKIKLNSKKIVEGADVALLASDYFDYGRMEKAKTAFQFDVTHFKDIMLNENVLRIKEEIEKYILSNKGDCVLISNNSKNTQLYNEEIAGIETLLYGNNLPVFLKKMNKIGAIFTSHLHLSIVAYSYRIPCFSLYVREKTKRFYDQIGHPERAVDLSTATPDDLSRLLDQMKDAVWTEYDEQRLRELQRKSELLINLL